MKLTIDSNILDKNNITLEEFMLLYISAKNIDINSIKESIVAKNLAEYDLFSENKLVVSDNTKELIANISIDSDKNVIDEDEKYTELAIKLREIYPSGRKEGTSYMWRGTTIEIARKLKTLVVKYKYTLNEDDIIQATKDYISSFNGNYRYMQLLKYFILKSVRDADGNTEVKSELMSLIENKGQLDSEREDWVSTMI